MKRAPATHNSPNLKASRGFWGYFWRSGRPLLRTPRYLRRHWHLSVNSTTQSCRRVFAASSSQRHWRTTGTKRWKTFSAPPSSGPRTQANINTVLRFEAYNAGIGALPTDASYTRDELTAYRWITDLAEASTSRMLIDDVRSRARSPWTTSITFGAGASADAVSAYLQAEWAGAFWLRRSLQRVLSALILSENSAPPRQLASAVAMWTLSGLREIEGVVEIAEPGFDPDSGDQAVGEVAREGPLRARTAWPLAELAVAVWDIISRRP